MKQLLFTSILLLSTLIACVPKSEKKETLEDFKKNHFDLKLTEEHRYGAISFKLSNSLLTNYSHSYTITNRSKTYHSYQLGIHFTVERFSEKDLKMEFVRDQVISKDLLNTFQDAYAYKRYSTLTESGISVKKTVPKKIKFPGVIQTISGEAEYSDGLTYYVTSTLKIGKEYYVFQWITSQEFMPYVYDDFENILRSVRKVK